MPPEDVQNLHDSDPARSKPSDWKALDPRLAEMWPDVVYVPIPRRLYELAQRLLSDSTSSAHAKVLKGLRDFIKWRLGQEGETWGRCPNCGGVATSSDMLEIAPGRPAACLECQASLPSHVLRGAHRRSS